MTRTQLFLGFSHFFLVAVLVTVAARAAGPATSADAEAKARALLLRMTIDEKIGQMTQVDMNALKDRADITRYCLGSMLSGGNSDPPDITAAGWARAYDDYQTWALKTRLKIPLIYGIDAVHGHNNVNGAVIFPHNIGLGATRNPRLVEQAARATAVEVSATGISWVFAPCIAVARDIRWGRSYESFGETPELAELGAASVRGFQGRSLADPTAVLACAKHFMGDGGTTGGVDQGNTECDEAALRRIHLPGYAAAVKAGVGSIMVSYNSFNGRKMHGNRHLLTDVLKDELGFQGFLVSDWAAIDQLSKDYKGDIEQSINAGLDMIMIPNGPGQANNYVDFIRLFKELVAEGRVPQSRIDDAVLRILKIKLKSRIFEHPYADPSLLAKVGCPEHRRIARECVRQSLVLLKNEKHILPLSKQMKHLVVAGKAADDIGIQCGGWTIDWQGKPGNVIKGGTTILAAIRNTVSAGTKVTFSPDGKIDADADAVLVIVGEIPYAEMLGDRKDLSLSPRDAALVERAAAAGKPVVTLLLSGRPLIIGPALEKSDAFIAAWLPGTEGQGVADVLFGDYKPTGKLPHTWPRSMAQVPCPGGRLPQGRELAADGGPLFPYGFGLTY
jgi:beta-glucosidase